MHSGMGDRARMTAEVAAAPASDVLLQPQGAAQSTLQQIAAKDKLKVALAVAITAKKKQVQRDGVDWKKKALAARQTLLALSKTLKSSGQASSDLHGNLLHLLREFSDSQLLQGQQQPQQTVVVERSSNLSSFIDATQVQWLLLLDFSRAVKRSWKQLDMAADCERYPGLEVRKTWSHLGEEAPSAALHSSAGLNTHSARRRHRSEDTASSYFMCQELGSPR